MSSSLKANERGETSPVLPPIQITEATLDFNIIGAIPMDRQLKGEASKKHHFPLTIIMSKLMQGH